VYDIVLKNVSFQYGGPKSAQVLKNVNITIPEGKVTAIVGTSGSGKTTLLKLLLHFYRPTEGQILMGRKDLSEISPGWWRSQCGTVMQDGVIFSDTIAGNIAVGDEEIDPVRLEQAIRMANIRDFIESLPLGYYTRIGNTGTGISAGQKQRILI